jgi:hypothetical protein
MIFIPVLYFPNYRMIAMLDTIAYTKIFNLMCKLYFSFYGLFLHVYMSHLYQYSNILVEILVNSLISSAHHI